MSKFGDLAVAQLRKWTKGKDDNVQEEIPESYPYSRLAIWATRDVYQDELLPLLNKHISDNEALRNTNLSNHPVLTYYQGRIDSLIAIRMMFDTWRKDDE